MLRKSSTRNHHALFLCRTGSATRQEEGDNQELPAHHTSWHRQRPQLHLCGQQPGGADGQTCHCCPQCPPYVGFVVCHSAKLLRWLGPNCFCVDIAESRYNFYQLPQHLSNWSNYSGNTTHMLCIWIYSHHFSPFSNLGWFQVWFSSSQWFSAVFGAGDFLPKQHQQVDYLQHLDNRKPFVFKGLFRLVQKEIRNDCSQGNCSLNFESRRLMCFSNPP